MGTWWPGLTGEATHPAETSLDTWETKCPTVLVLPSGFGIIVKPTSLHETWTALLRVLALPQEYFPAQDISTGVVHKHSSAGSLGWQ